MKQNQAFSQLQRKRLGLELEAWLTQQDDLSPAPRNNVWAAERNCRMLAHQKDYNRIWKRGDSAEEKLATEVLRYVQTQRLFANIDIHNNSGANPLYSCVNKMDQDFLHLASLFSDLTVYFENPSTVQAHAMAQFCPSVTIECGRSGNQVGEQKAWQFVWDVLNIPTLKKPAYDEQKSHLYQTLGRIIPLSNIHFGEKGQGISFPAQIDHLNFHTLKKGTEFAKQTEEKLQLTVMNNQGQDISSYFFELKNESILLKRDIVPAMLTQDLNGIYKDCLGYVMEEVK